MQIKLTEPSRFFLVTGGGAGLNFDHPCAHGRPAISFHLLSNRHGQADDLGLLLPSCSAPSLFGAALAYFTACHGEEAGEMFLAELLAARDEAAALLTSRRAAYEAAEEACCQASVFTGGREHTCHTSR